MNSKFYIDNLELEPLYTTCRECYINKEENITKKTIKVFKTLEAATGYANRYAKGKKFKSCIIYKDSTIINEVAITREEIKIEVSPSDSEKFYSSNAYDTVSKINIITNEWWEDGQTIIDKTLNRFATDRANLLISLIKQANQADFTLNWNAINLVDKLINKNGKSFYEAICRFGRQLEDLTLDKIVIQGAS